MGVSLPNCSITQSCMTHKLVTKAGSALLQPGGHLLAIV